MSAPPVCKILSLAALAMDLLSLSIAMGTSLLIALVASVPKCLVVATLLPSKKGKPVTKPSSTSSEFAIVAVFF
jgi:hypothetical protein